MPNLYLTNKQCQVMAVIVKGNGRDAAGNFIPVDLDELLERIPYETTKASMQFTIRHLVEKGCITKGVEKRRCYNRAVYIPTPQGLSMLKSEDEHWLAHSGPSL
jgi:hypothetical protein